MKVLVITGSAHKNGTSAYLAEQFIKGAKAAGHEVFRFDAAQRDVHPCIACERCHNTDKGCVFKDDMQELNPHLIEADAIAFVTPIYYYTVNAQIKAVIDRFYANDAALHKNKKAALMVTMADDVAATANSAVDMLKGLVGFMDWEIAGTVIGVDCGDMAALLKTGYPQAAYELGKNLH